MQKILKVRFDHITLVQATETALQWAQGDEQKQICTPNPEMLLEARTNNKFQKILNQSDLNIPDGIGILWASKFLKITENTKSKGIKILKWLYSLIMILIFPSYIRSELPERVTGADLMQEICKKCPGLKLKVFLLGASDGVAEKTKEVLTHNYPSLNIVGTHCGSPKEKEAKEIIELIEESEAQILFVAFGAPKQEFWINSHLKKMPKVKVAIGVGGSFDFISGMHKRAPKWMHKIGLEWLYRLVQQPKRIVRIYKATIKFPILILRKSLKS